MWLFLAGCGQLTATNFHDRANTLYCENLERCTNLFAVDYGTVEGCVAELGESYALLYTCERTACRFDTVDAETCLENLDGATCEEFSAGDSSVRCDDVFDDCDEVAFDRCVEAG